MTKRTRSEHRVPTVYTPEVNNTLGMSAEALAEETGMCTEDLEHMAEDMGFEFEV